MTTRNSSNLYLEKYSVAPAPSRDYYGLKISDNEIELFRWPISHGPHKNPSKKSCYFSDWKKDKSLQEEIEKIFGESLVKYTNEVVSNRASLLTLPSHTITKLLNYLPPEDIINLLLLSKAAHQAFNKDFVPQLIRKKYLRSKIWNIKGNSDMSFGWKQLMQETEQIGMTVKCKSTRIRGTSSAPRISQKNIQKTTSKPQLEITKIVSPKRQISSAGQNSNRSGLSQKPLSERRLKKEKVLLNTVNLEFENPDKKSTRNIPERHQVFNPPKLANEMKKITAKKSESKSSLLCSKHSSSSNISSLKSGGMSIGNLIKKPTSEFKDIETFFDCGFEWCNGLTLSSDEKKIVKQDNVALNPQEFEYCKNKISPLKNYSTDKFPSKESSKELSRWQKIKMRTLKSYDDFEADLLTSYPSMSDNGTKKKSVSHRKIS